MDDIDFRNPNTIIWQDPSRELTQQPTLKSKKKISEPGIFDDVKVLMPRHMVKFAEKIDKTSIQAKVKTVLDNVVFTKEVGKPGERTDNQITKLIDYVQTHHLSDWEQEFIPSVCNQYAEGRSLSEKQWTCVNKIINKHNI